VTTVTNTPGAILLYHRVATVDPDPFHLCLTPDVFHTHVRALREHCRPMPLRTLVQSARQGNLPPRAVAVTFDDGYLDNLTNASPILQECEVPATFFLTTDRLDTLHEFWWDTLTRIVLDESTGADAVELPFGGRFRFPLDSIEQRLRALLAVHGALRRLQQRDRESLLHAVVAQLSNTKTPVGAARPMVVAEVRTLADRPGHDIGLHTVHHLSLPVQTAEVQYAEIADCRLALERALSRRLTTLAYPFGEVDASTVAAATAAGIDVALCAGGGPMHAGCNPLMLPRVEVTSDMGPDDLLALFPLT
jgi:peptidoglycan/xylan/chitin deacetylase (PgdA/CDA1 family)